MSQKTEVAPGNLEIEATVGLVRGEGGDRFAVAYPRDPHSPIGTSEITFTTSVFEDSREPRKGEVVRLSEIRMFAKGWRALRARPITPEVTSRKSEGR